MNKVQVPNVPSQSTLKFPRRVVDYYVIFRCKNEWTLSSDRRERARLRVHLH